MQSDFAFAKEELSQIGIVWVSRDFYTEPRRKGSCYFVKSPATHDKTVEEVQELQGYSQSVISLDTPIAEDNSLTLADTLQARMT